MPGKTVRIDDTAYALLLKEKGDQQSLSLSDIANIAIKGYFSEEKEMIHDWLKQEVIQALTAERAAHREEISHLKDHIAALKDALDLERQTVARERQLADSLIQVMRASGPLNVSENEQTDTKENSFVYKLKKALRLKP
jgi:predicted CopG family antitoxin